MRRRAFHAGRPTKIEQRVAPAVTDEVRLARREHTHDPVGPHSGFVFGNNRAARGWGVDEPVRGLTAGQRAQPKPAMSSGAGRLVLLTGATGFKGAGCGHSWSSRVTVCAD